MPKVRTGGVIEDEPTEIAPVLAKKPRIDIELEDGKYGKKDKASLNVVLGDEDEKVRMVSNFLEYHFNFTAEI